MTEPKQLSKEQIEGLTAKYELRPGQVIDCDGMTYNEVSAMLAAHKDAADLLSHIAHLEGEIARHKAESDARERLLEKESQPLHNQQNMEDAAEWKRTHNA